MLRVPAEEETVHLRRTRARIEYRRVRVARRAKPRAGPARRVCEAPGVPLMPESQEALPAWKMLCERSVGAAICAG